MAEADEIIDEDVTTKQVQVAMLLKESPATKLKVSPHLPQAEL